MKKTFISEYNRPSICLSRKFVFHIYINFLIHLQLLFNDGDDVDTINKIETYQRSNSNLCHPHYSARGERKQQDNLVQTKERHRDREKVGEGKNAK